jgi:hypothetical protein
MVLAVQPSRAGRSVVLRIEHEPLAVDHLAVLHIGTQMQQRPLAWIS